VICEASALLRSRRGDERQRNLERHELAPSAQGEAEPKVTICHVPPGNPENAHEITVAEASLKAHFPHGDTLGTCEGEPPPPAECAGECSLLDETCCIARLDCAWTLDELENGMCVVEPAE
jgi:hypothetical protein